MGLICEPSAARYGQGRRKRGQRESGIDRLGGRHGAAQHLVEAGGALDLILQGVLGAGKLAQQVEDLLAAVLELLLAQLDLLAKITHLDLDLLEIDWHPVILSGLTPLQMPSQTYVSKIYLEHLF